MSGVKYTCSKSYALPANRFSRRGYHFAGWARSSTGAVRYKNKASVKNLSSTNGATVVLYAKWAVNSYKIAFYANGGRGSMSRQAIAYGKSKALYKNRFARSGYVFAGWAKSARGTVAYKDGGIVKNLSSKNGATVKLYAKWLSKTQKYYVAFDGNGGTGTMAKQTMKYGTKVALKKNTFKRAGYIFAGWATKTGGAVKYKNGQSVIALTDKKGGIVTLYAVWKLNAITISFEETEGYGKMDSFTIACGKTAELPACTFESDWYAFVGWSTEEYGWTIEYADGDEIAADKDAAGKKIKLYAVWAYKEAVRYAHDVAEINQYLIEAEDEFIEYILLCPGEYDGMYDPATWDTPTKTVPIAGYDEVVLVSTLAN